MADVHELLAKYRKDKKAANAQLALTPSFGVGAYHRQPGGRVWAPARAPAQHPRPAARPTQPARRASAPAYAYGYPQQGGYVGDAPANVPAPTADPYYPNGNPRDPSNPPGSPGQYPPGPPGGAPYPQPPQGQTYPQPPECDPCGHGVTMHCETPTPCGANAIGQTTFGSEGIPPGVVTPVVVTAGDAKSFKPTKLFFEAMPWASPDLIDTDRLRGRSSLPLFLVDALVGRKSQLRRGGSPALGISQSAYANSKEIELVDWEEFTSTTEHNLSLLFFNPNKDIPVHASVVLWGDI